MKTFYHILGNNVVSGITNFTVWFAIIFYVYLQTKSVFATSIISGIYLVMTAGSGFWLGSLVDRFRKKQVMLFSSIFSLVTFIIGFVIYTSVDPQTFSRVDSAILWIFVSLLLLGVIAGNLRNIAIPTLVTLLVSEDKRDKANGLVGTASGISFMVTSVISGFLVGRSGMYLVLLLGIVATILSIIHLWFIPVTEKRIIHIKEIDGVPVPHGNESNNLDIRGTLKAVSAIPGLFALILFTMFNNFLGGVYMSLMDAYGLSLVSVEVWGVMWGVLSTAFIIGGLVIAKWGLGKNPLRSMFIANIIIWSISSVFTIPQNIIVLVGGMFVYLTVVPFIQASEQTIIQKVVPPERQGRVFGFAQSVEQSASPLTAFLIGPLTQFFFIPFMTDGWGAQTIGPWFGTGSARGIALVFTITGIIGLCMTIAALNSKYYKQLSQQYLKR